MGGPWLVRGKRAGAHEGARQRAGDQASGLDHRVDRRLAGSGGTRMCSGAGPRAASRAWSAARTGRRDRGWSAEQAQRQGGAGPHVHIRAVVHQVAERRARHGQRERDGARGAQTTEFAPRRSTPAGPGLDDPGEWQQAVPDGQGDEARGPADDQADDGQGRSGQQPAQRIEPTVRAPGCQCGERLSPKAREVEGAEDGCPDQHGCNPTAGQETCPGCRQAAHGERR